LINCFKSYSSLGDDRFLLCHPVCGMRAEKTLLIFFLFRKEMLREDSLKFRRGDTNIEKKTIRL